MAIIKQPKNKYSLLIILAYHFLKIRRNEKLNQTLQKTSSRLLKKTSKYSKR